MSQTRYVTCHIPFICVFNVRHPHHKSQFANATSFLFPSFFHQHQPPSLSNHNSSKWYVLFAWLSITSLKTRPFSLFSTVWKRKSVRPTPCYTPKTRTNAFVYRGKSSGKATGDSKTQSRSAKAGLQFPVGRIHRLLKKGNYAQRVGAGAPGQSLLVDCIMNSRSCRFFFPQST